MGQVFKVVSVNVSEKKRTIKTPVDQIELNELGVKSDAHSGLWQRQVSLLGTESIRKFEAEAGRRISFGEFAENITTEGLILYETSPLDRLIIGDTELEITQIGKKCHGYSCSIFKEVGNCVMPKEGIFARVIRTGTVKAGDRAEYLKKIYNVHIITLSDRASRGEYEDKSGPRIIELTTQYFNKQNLAFESEHTIIPDDPDALRILLQRAVETGADVVFTTGGTGVGPHDFTPDVVKDLVDKEIPGIMESIRVKYGLEKPNALLSRGIAGIIDKTLIYTLPGSVNAVNDYLSEIFKTFSHLIFMLHAIDSH
jgi:molybdenum cofactor synthesis domain-containing protein